mmetsp:Transcript_2779/g.5619  ORF Transcript_2779/g.5619 Transcript_2779/m.5619 type:complete len:396 (+) Transcript_2779:370-1557(+)
MVFVIRHAERLDRQEPSWSALAKRPQDTPLSALGKKQAERLGKWLYGRLPVHAPLAIFCSPFIRCVQTADAVASQLEGLQHAGLHASSATKICIEPGLCEDMTYMNQLKQQEPWILNAADLVCASPRVDLSYKPLRVVTHERGPVYPGGCVETTPGGTLERCNTIALELANHPLVRPNGTALIITHGNPSTHMVKSLCPRPGGIHLPDYADIKAGNYDGPPLQYTACTALKKKKKVGGDEGGAGGDEWDLAPGFKVFSNEHDPRLKTNRKIKKLKVTRYVTAHGHGDAPGTREMRDFQVAAEVLKDAEAGTAVTVPHPDTGDALTFTLPAEFKSGDRMRIRHIASAFSGAKGVEEPGVHGAAKTVPTRKGIKIGDVDATEKTKAAYAETILVKSA